jgi:hypothetical protein
LFGFNSRSVPGTSASSVSLGHDQVVEQFRDAVQLKYDKPNYLKDIPSGALSVYKNKTAFDKRKATVNEKSKSR